MRFITISTLWLLIVGIVSPLGSVWAPPCWANDAFVRNMVLGLIQPSEPPLAEEQKLGAIDLLLAIPFEKLKNGAFQYSSSADDARSHVPQITPRGNGVFSHQNINSTKAAQPGLIRRSLGLSQLRAEGIRPVLANAGHNLYDSMSAKGYLGSAGSLAGNVTTLYSSFNIDISKTDYTLRLFGTRNGQQHELYSTRVGIGSPEFPTPRGKFYITMIYDDHPWWIPPNRPWAWGQIPSRNVYGGHMMPLLSKRPLKKSDKNDFHMDKIAPKMKIVDSGAYRVHGTDSPWSVGSNQSHGCIRMKNSTVKALADTLKFYVGTTTRGESPNGTYITLTRPVRVMIH